MASTPSAFPPNPAAAPDPDALAAALIRQDNPEEALRAALAAEGSDKMVETLLRLEKENPTAARRVLQLLGRLTVSESAQALVAYRERAKAKALRKVAGTSLARLAAAGIEPPTKAAEGPVRERDPHPARHALLSMYDRDFTRQLLIPLRRVGSRGAILLLINEERGIVRAVPAADMSLSEFAGFQNLHGPRFDRMIPIPLDYAYWLFHQARQRSEGTDTPLPPELAPWVGRIPEPEKEYPRGLLPVAAPKFWQQAEASAVPWASGAVLLEAALSEPEGMLLLNPARRWEAAERAVVRLESMGGLVLSPRARREALERAIAQVAEEVYGGEMRKAAARSAYETAYWLWHFELEEKAKAVAALGLPLDDEDRPAADSLLVRFPVVMALQTAAEELGFSGLREDLAASLPRPTRPGPWQATPSRLLVPREAAGSESVDR